MAAGAANPFCLGLYHRAAGNVRQRSRSRRPQGAHLVPVDLQLRGQPEGQIRVPMLRLAPGVVALRVATSQISMPVA